MVISAIGSLIGVVLILMSSQSAFEHIVPFFMRAACGLYLPSLIEKLPILQNQKDAGRLGLRALVPQLVASV